MFRKAAKLKKVLYLIVCSAAFILTSVALLYNRQAWNRCSHSQSRIGIISRPRTFLTSTGHKNLHLFHTYWKIRPWRLFYFSATLPFLIKFISFEIMICAFLQIYSVSPEWIQIWNHLLITDFWCQKLPCWCYH